MIHNYFLYICIWLGVSIITLLLFRFISRKMKDTDDRQTKNSLFTILIMLGIPLLMVSVLGPMIFIIGDKTMETSYKAVWIALVAVFIIYFIIKQKSGSKENA